MHQATGGSHFLPHRDICKEDQEGDWWRWIDCSSTVARALMHVYERLNERRCPKVGQEAPRGIKKEVCMAANFIATSPKWNFHLLIFGIRRKLAWFYNWTRESFAFFSTFCKIFAFLSYLAIVETILCKLDIFAIFKWNFEDFQIHYKFILTLKCWKKKANLFIFKRGNALKSVKNCDKWTKTKVEHFRKRVGKSDRLHC